MGYFQWRLGGILFQLNLNFFEWIRLKNENIIHKPNNTCNTLQIVCKDNHCPPPHCYTNILPFRRSFLLFAASIETLQTHKTNQIQIIFFYFIFGHCH